VLFGEFRADPENDPLRTPSGRIEIYSDEKPGSPMTTARRIRFGSNPPSGLAVGRRPRFRCNLSPANRATACAHGNANVLTRDHGTSRLSRGPSSATAPRPCHSQ
jgi:hypothetical protein